MAKRPAFFIQNGRVVSKMYSFEWFPGFALSQKQKSIESLHSAIVKANPGAKPLEISTKSAKEAGAKLSVFHLKLEGHTLENIFQSAKVFEGGGPYLDLLEVPPREAKRDERLRQSGGLVAFRYQGEDFPLVPKTAFYDYIYIAAVKNTLTADEISEVLQYDFFTDIEFNPDKSINTQARTVSLIRLILEEHGALPDFTKDEFIKYHGERVVY